MFKLTNNEVLAKLFADLFCAKFGVCTEPVRHPRQRLFAICVDGIPYKDLGLSHIVPSIEHWKNEQAA